MIDDVQKDTEERMKKALESLKRELQTIRTGRASTSLVDRLQVDYYGTPTPLNQLATVTTPEARLLVIQPWDKGALALIEKALQKSEMGFNPTNDGRIIRIPIPPLTEDRRRDMVKVVKHKVEDSRVAIRNVRRDALHSLKELLDEKMISEDEQKRANEKIETLVQKYVHEADGIGQTKEAEVLEV